MVYITSKAGIALLLCLCAAPLVSLLRSPGVCHPVVPAWGLSMRLHRIEVSGSPRSVPLPFDRCVGRSRASPLERGSWPCHTEITLRRRLPASCTLTCLFASTFRPCLTQLEGQAH